MPTEPRSKTSAQREVRTHCSFLLRCSRSGIEEHYNTSVWRFSVREVAEKPEEYHFNSPGELLDFLLTRLGEETVL